MSPSLAVVVPSSPRLRASHHNASHSAQLSVIKGASKASITKHDMFVNGIFPSSSREHPA